TCRRSASRRSRTASSFLAAEQAAEETFLLALRLLLRGLRGCLGSWRRGLSLWFLLGRFCLRRLRLHRRFLFRVQLVHRPLHVAGEKLRQHLQRFVDRRVDGGLLLGRRPLEHIV